MSDELDQHPSLREHLGLRERVTVLEGGQANIIQTLNRIEARQLTSSQPPPAAHDSTLLALHDLAKSMRDTTASKSGGSHPMLTAFAMIGALALGALGVLLLT